MVGGSGARVPNRFLNAKGEFVKGEQSSGGSGGRDRPNSIDLTLDDSRSDEDDEPEVTAVRKSDIESDEIKNNGPVCLGSISAIVLCMMGMPEPIKTRGPAATHPSLDKDPAWAKDNWPGASRWPLQPGYRPVSIRMRYPRKPNHQAARTTGNWSHGGQAPQHHQGKPELEASAILSPMANIERQRKAGYPEDRISRTPHILEPFGNMGDRYTAVLQPLLEARQINCEARCRMVSAEKTANFLFPIDLLIFTVRPLAKYVAERLSMAGIYLEVPPPEQFSPTDYEGEPPLLNLHANSAVRDNNLGRHRYGPSMILGGAGGGGGSGYGTVQTREMTDEERKKQLESVYDTLVSGEDLEMAETSELVSSELFPHQRQAVTFLLERERGRSFEEPDLPKDGNVSLWQPIKSRVDGTIRLYRNIVTQHEQPEEPKICRGAILADDMGLGKTITVIATLASTLKEAKDFERSFRGPSRGIKELLNSNGKRAAQNNAEDGDDTLADIASQLQGGGAAKKGKAPAEKKKKIGKQEAQRNELEKAQIENIDIRSRATLIVCPLSIVSNWEEQIKEHWKASSRPKVYIYHGSSRSTSPAEIADHDIVMTTYATLASEFANQRIWTTGDAASEDEGSATEDDDSDFAMLDENGRALPSNGKQKKAEDTKGGRKKRKRPRGKEAINPLQRIEWFRIVLDEAHTIKEARTMQCRAVCNLSAQRRLSLTGTPVQNRLDDLYSQIKFIRLEPFSDRKVWDQHCGQRQKKSSLVQRSNASQKNEPLEQVALVKVQTIMKFLTLRRTKDSKKANGEPILQLPPKNTRLAEIFFDEREQTKYKDLHARYKEDFEEMQAAGSVGTNYATILQEISNLRMCCDHPGLVDSSKDLKRLREGDEDLSSAIKRDGITRERAAKLFDIFSESSAAECGVCRCDLSRFSEDAAGGATALEEGGDDRIKPVMTKCCHLFCSSCFLKKAGPRWKNLKKLKAEELMNCPSCGVSLSILMDAILLEGGDVTSTVNSPRDAFNWSDDEDNGPGNKKLSSRHRDGFGADRNIDLDDRTELSSKIRFLLGDLIPFSACNPASMLYDPSAQQLLHCVPTKEQLASGEARESVCLATDQIDPTVYEPVKSIVFSQWTTMLDRIGKALHRAGISYVRLDGTMRRQERAVALEDFKSKKNVEVFLISLRAGGFGLNLVSACRAYIVEPAWNPALESQASDRIVRLGQTKPTIITKLIMKQSIEERMLELQKMKQDLANKVSEKRGKVDDKGDKHGDIRVLLGDGSAKA
ncbi:hypothetical protein BCV69DRAFT_269201 [Microstroma glucosiphilum]|uniref:Uncharacterized protein n=1 Tax=Pseudomicrostroma glucosiphilum TaxID=1684307 RepID=A0A316UAP1_9BASI|nr:hypothetical protein BCV69DRAFT_269201 [Pseudomicrostroma glucosiphilum]PWN21483.1 hypothetical protein BCV69DRAFT_269201 [Pseudomicrostroma glucosiphilum]